MSTYIPAAASVWGDAPSANDSRTRADTILPRPAGNAPAEHPYSSPYATNSAFTTPPARSAREIELDARETELRLREAKVSMREKDAGDYHPPNWPPFRPMVYHDIEGDIPKNGQWLVKRLFSGWYLASLTFLLNLIAAFSLLVTKAESAGATFGIALLMTFLGIPMSFVFWYRSLYLGVKHDRSINFMFFFFNYSCHLAIMVIMCIGIPGWGGAGFIYMFSQFNTNLGSAILCIISSSFFIFQVLYGIWQIKAVHTYFRSKGLTTDQARNQAVQGVASSKIGQEVGRQAVKQAVVGATSGSH
ncbi:hypothetical protein BASA50_004793 [Batrachochytrium salamandrivorans]|uniref:Secretory carrier membrane protein n=1 Tax=Batrachochytrium salamandrivorans TaxID=1357716 RepID=A0ABQ8FER6_9FUNG|nr:hypothetical protein BASA60_007897 [Batrachochytrium salamandrivorans]KAH6571669.1 hypothetical protein BASA62_003755 [Batrachochytrium salamandrivorans]KAH6590680.1 hypothetical protein BASA61_005200 [Batrachochytrium salamandrivorans]KAH6597035.1 hypothetical protein BASA50_004793 [Batrachochytrium salamandrivorans]KAH9273418.1 hypothetical protein BASA83_004082 [Batrachochytrium salamandrivorans]